MRDHRTDDKPNVLLMLRSRDLPFAYAMLLLLAVVTVCSMTWLWLSQDGLTSTRLSVPQNAPAKFKVNINQAAWPEMANLPKVGPALAKAIVEYRETHGPFQSAKDLTNVTGVGPKKLVAIEPFLSALP